MRYKRFILLLGIILGSYAPAAAQSPEPKIVLAQEHVVPITTMLRESTPLLTASFLLYQDSGKSPTTFRYLYEGAYDHDQGLEGLARLSPMREVNTSFLTQSSLPLAHLWGGRLRLDGFKSTLHMQNVELGPSVASGLQDFVARDRVIPAGFVRSMSTASA